MFCFQEFFPPNFLRFTVLGFLFIQQDFHNNDFTPFIKKLATIFKGIFAYYFCVMYVPHAQNYSAFHSKFANT